MELDFDFSFGESRLARYLVLFVVVLIPALLLRGKSERKGQAGAPFAPPVPYRLPLGLDLAYEVVKRFGDHSFLDYAKDHLLNVPGRTVEINLLGNPIVLTDRRENIKAIQQDQFADFAKGQVPHDVFKSILGDSVFTTDGPLWKSSRSQLDPHVSRLRPDDQQVAEVHVQNMLKLFHNGGKGGVPVYDIIDRLQLDIVTEVFLGESTRSLEADDQPFREAMETLLQVNTMRLPFGRLANLVPDWLLAPKAFRDLNKYIDALIDKTLAHPANQGEEWKSEKELNLVEDLVKQHPNDRMFIRGQLVAILMASKDPAALLITWAIYELARRPELIKELQAEIQEHIGLDTVPRPEQLNGLTKLQNVVKETIRMYHPLGLNVREARADATLPVGGGPDGSLPVSVFKGQLMLYSVAGLQRSEAIHGPDAAVWNPRRWETYAPQPGEYLPFSLGPRQCPGRVFGQFQVHYTLARVLQEFDTVRWCGYGTGNPADDREPMKIKLELNCKCAAPVVCEFIPRT